MCPEMYIGMPFTQGTKYSSTLFITYSFSNFGEAKEE
jgi:hypothetical protein